MEHIRVNFNLNLEVWNRFIMLVPKKERGNSINMLLKKEVEKINRLTETQTLASAFKEASKDKKRQNALKKWN
jgi:hypothetical protein